MGKYIYEGHMGSIYATDELQSFDSLYCEECGDSDTYIGYANNANEAWDLLKDKTDLFDEEKCNACEHKEDYDYCNEHCDEYAKSGGFSLNYIMEFLYREFSNDIKWHHVYLLMKQKNYSDFYLVRCDMNGYGFSEKHSVPHSVCIDKKYVHMIANSMTLIAEDADESTLTLLTTKHMGDKIIHIFECFENEPDSDDWCESAYYSCDGWYGYMEKEKIHLLDDEELIFTDIF